MSTEWAIPSQAMTSHLSGWGCSPSRSRHASPLKRHGGSLQPGIRRPEMRSTALGAAPAPLLGQLAKQDAKQVRTGPGSRVPLLNAGFRRQGRATEQQPRVALIAPLVLRKFLGKACSVAAARLGASSAGASPRAKSCTTWVR